MDGNLLVWLAAFVFGYIVPIGLLISLVQQQKKTNELLQQALAATPRPG